MPFQDTTEYETWENRSKGRVAIQKYDPSQRTGRTTEVVAGGRKFNITPSERRLNMEMASDVSVDIFSNGVLAPVRLLEDADIEETKKLTTNPNHLDEAEMIALVKAPWKAFDKRLAEITNLNTVERLLEIAKDQEIGATVRTVAQLQEKLLELNPAHVEERTPAGVASDREGGLRAVTPR